MRQLIAFALLMLAVLSLRLLRRALHERKLRRLLRAGDWGGVLATYHPTLSRLPNPETLGPLMVAGALAAHGMVDRARRALARAVRGEAWEAALEHRRFIETLLETFDGDRGRAVECAESLEKLPLPKGSAPARRRVAALRAALTALARAFARRPLENDAEVLEEAANSSPLVHWAMRYGAAVAYLERGDRQHARRLLLDAPRWPEDSTFCAFQEELASLAREPSTTASAV